MNTVRRYFSQPEPSVGEGAQHAGEQPAEAGPPHPGLLTQRYERGSTVITSNLPFEDWTQVLASERLTGALLDRLTHHVSILTMNGDSYRLKQSAGRRSARRAEQNQATVSAAPDTGGIPLP